MTVEVQRRRVVVRTGAERHETGGATVGQRVVNAQRQRRVCRNIVIVSSERRADGGVALISIQGVQINRRPIPVDIQTTGTGNLAVDRNAAALSQITRLEITATGTQIENIYFP